jgi:hypothetical protein
MFDLSPEDAAWLATLFIGIGLAFAVLLASWLWGR